MDGWVTQGMATKPRHGGPGSRGPAARPAQLRAEGPEIPRAKGCARPSAHGQVPRGALRRQRHPLPGESPSSKSPGAGEHPGEPPPPPLPPPLPPPPLAPGHGTSLAPRERVPCGRAPRREWGQSLRPTRHRRSRHPQPRSPRRTARLAPCPQPPRRRAPPTHFSCSPGRPRPASAPPTRPSASSGTAPAPRPSCCRCAAARAGCSCGAPAATWERGDRGSRPRRRRPLPPPGPPPPHRGCEESACPEPPALPPSPAMGRPEGAARPPESPSTSMPVEPRCSPARPGFPGGRGPSGLRGGAGQRRRGGPRLLRPPVGHLILLQEELRRGTGGTGCVEPRPRAAGATGSGTGDVPSRPPREPPVPGGHCAAPRHSPALTCTASGAPGCRSSSADRSVSVSHASSSSSSASSMVGVSPGTEARRCFFLPFFGTPFLRRVSGGRWVESGWWMWWDDWRWSGGGTQGRGRVGAVPAAPPRPRRPHPGPQTHTRSPPRRSCARPPRRCGGARRTGSPRSARRPAPCSGPSPPPPPPRRRASRRPAPPARAAGRPRAQRAAALPALPPAPSTPRSRTPPQRLPGVPKGPAPVGRARRHTVGRAPRCWAPTGAVCTQRTPHPPNLCAARWCRAPPARTTAQRRPAPQ